MDIDTIFLDPNLHHQDNPESCQPSHMDEDPQSFNLGVLDLLGLEEACKRKEFDKINPSQIETLETVLFRAQQQRKLGIQPGSHWDGLKITRESKKRGRKLDWKCTITLGEMLVQ